MQVTPYYVPPIDSPAMANSITRDIAAKNIAMLMQRDGLTQMELAKRAGVSQKTISNMLNPGQGVNSPRLDNVTAVAQALGLELWQLLLPQIPDDAREIRALSTVVENYLFCSSEGRANISRVAELERTFAERKR